MGFANIGDGFRLAVGVCVASCDGVEPRGMGGVDDLRESVEGYGGYRVCFGCRVRIG